MKTISSLSHDLVKHWSRLHNSRSYRYASRRVLVEGKNLLKDLLPRHSPLRLILTQEQTDAFDVYQGERLQITPAIASKISAVEEPEGCFAEYELPCQRCPRTEGPALVLDGLQDPGNAGTLFRTALAFDVRTIFLIEPCVDPWNPKTLRSAKGAQFDLSLISCTIDTLPKEGSLVVADTRGSDVRTASIPHDWMLVLGNEAHGHRIPSSRHPLLVTIPMPGPVESLNVSQAGAILLYTLTNSSKKTITTNN